MSGGLRRLALAAALLPLLAASGRADDLTLADGVVVKFGAQGELVVRDGLVVQGQATFTSINDDARGGAVRSTPGAPLAGDWIGLRLERSSPASVTRLGGLQLLFGGRGGPAFTLRSTQIALGGFSVSRSAGVGLASTSGATSPLSELVLSQNAVGFQAEAGAAVALQSSVIIDNTSFGAVILDPGRAIAARGLWWGHPSGPLDTSDDRAQGGLFNPGGLGNPVSDGILYAPAGQSVPLDLHLSRHCCANCAHLRSEIETVSVDPEVD